MQKMFREGNKMNSNNQYQQSDIMAQGTADTLKSRFYLLQNVDGEDRWSEQCEGYPIFFKEDSIFRLRYIALPSRVIQYDIVVNTNTFFERNENGIQWTQIKENKVMAISFKQQYSAHAFWQLIDDYQRKYGIAVPAAEGVLFHFEYKVPDPTVNNLHLVLQQLLQIPEHERHERVMSIFLTKRDLFPKLISVFKLLEAKLQEEALDERQPIKQEINRMRRQVVNAEIGVIGENGVVTVPCARCTRQSLEIMFEIAKIIFNAANEELLYEMIGSESYMAVLGMLEYDPNFRCRQTSHRDFMTTQSRLVEVVSFRNYVDLFNLIVFTYRLDYVRESVLFPYLNDNSFRVTSQIIRSNYKKILMRIFDPKRKEFINYLFDHLRSQEVPAFRFLRQMFRVSKSFMANEIYDLIAQKDFFDIFLRNVKELTGTQLQPASKTRKKKRIEQVEAIVFICMEILEQFMEVDPSHLRKYCASEKIAAKYPICEFLLELFNSNGALSVKMGTILHCLLGQEGTDTHEIREMLKPCILSHFLSRTLPKDQQLSAHEDFLKHVMRWMPMMRQILLPVNQLITNQLQQILELVFETLHLSLASHCTRLNQISLIHMLRDLIHNYIVDPKQIERRLFSRAEIFAECLSACRGAMGIRISTVLSILVPPRYFPFISRIIECLQKVEPCSFFTQQYINLLRVVSSRKEVVLPVNLKREKSQKLLDEVDFEKLQKKVKLY